LGFKAESLFGCDVFYIERGKWGVRDRVLLGRTEGRKRTIKNLFLELNQLQKKNSKEEERTAA
jgi:hypothetical protein